MNTPGEHVSTQPNVAGVDPGAGWRLRYWSIFTGQALSLIGSAMTQFVLVWWITATTGDIGALATAGLAALLPQALLGPLGGTFADRYSRRLLMIAADATSALCMMVLIALFLTDRIELWHAYAMMSVRSAMAAFQAPASSASTAMLVPAGFLPRAAGLNQTMFGIMTVAAAPLGALAIGVMPIGMALWIDVATAVTGIVPLLIFTVPQQHQPNDQPRGMWVEFREGVRLVRRSPGLLRIYAMLGGVVLVIMPSFTLLPLLVTEHFAGGAQEVAILESVGGAGMIAGGMIVTALAPRRLVTWILWGFAFSCFTLAFTALTPPSLFWLAAASWGLSGLTFIMGNAPFTTLIQTTVPNHLQGRVLALLSTIMGFAAPVGLAAAAPLGELVGIRWLFVMMGTAGGCIGLAGFLSPTLRRFGTTMSGLRADREVPAVGGS
ncbi:membrane protein [Croceibacterium mercuriale]|uniref:Membrane protein n=1 Tax=Croceibacterium mercuriale TaxID=1572751 RepID=A0A0B2C3F4_9SPHN|nr:membrane protein [Croceibacterium mercuriale]